MQKSEAEKDANLPREPFLPITNLPHLCGEVSTKNQLFPTEMRKVDPLCGADIGELTLFDYLSTLFMA